MKDNNGLKNLASKMIKIMKVVGVMPKSGKNSFHGYSYATEADVAAAFSTAMQASGVFMFTSILERECLTYKTAGNKDSFLVTVKLEVTFVDVDSGESFTSTFFGDGSDSGDKAIYKAITGAQKYALMKTFLLQTGDDPEKSEAVREKVKYNVEVDSVKKDDLLESLKKVALGGKDVLTERWKTLTPAQRGAIKDQTPILSEIAKKADGSIREGATQ